MEASQNNRSRRTIHHAILVLLVCVMHMGCVRRRMTVRTNPPGAAVYVDRQLIGSSPASSSYTFYGTRHIEVVADGFRTEKVLRKISPPWYQIPPLDFLAETVWPWEIRDERIIDITMVPAEQIPADELTTRANTLRIQAQQGLATSLPPPVTAPEPFVLPPEANQPIAPQAPRQVLPPWRPGQFLRGFLQPGGQPVQRIPETSGSYRPMIDE
jgi:PEGA domain